MFSKPVFLLLAVAVSINAETIFCGCGTPSGTAIKYYDPTLKEYVYNATIEKEACGQCNFNAVPGRVRHIEIKEGVKYIPLKMFAGCTNLETVTIPESIEDIGDYAFDGCSNLKMIRIPRLATFGKIGISLSPCESLTSIEVEESHTHLKSDDGVVFQGTMLVRFPPGRKGSYTVPKDTTSITEYAFAGSVELKSLIIPCSVKSIGKGAFSDIPSLEKFEYKDPQTGEDCEFSQIDEDLFSGTGLKKALIPHSTVIIGRFAYKGSSVEEVVIPSSVKSIGPGAFGECPNLKRIDVAPKKNDNSNDTPSYSSVDGVLFDYEQATLIQYPCGKEGNYQVPEGVEEIGRSAFRASKSLTNVTIGESVEFIGENAFRDCTNLDTVKFLGFSDPGKYSLDVFEGCGKLRCIEVPSNYSSDSFCGVKLPFCNDLSSGTMIEATKFSLFAVVIAITFALIM